MVCCRWDACCCVLVLYVALMLPPQLAFGTTSSVGALRIVGLAVDAFFVLDVYVNLRTGVVAFLGSLS